MVCRTFRFKAISECRIPITKLSQAGSHPCLPFRRKLTKVISFRKTIFYVLNELNCASSKSMPGHSYSLKLRISSNTQKKRHHVGNPLFLKLPNHAPTRKLHGIPLCEMMSFEWAEAVATETTCHKNVQTFRSKPTANTVMIKGIYTWY